MRLRFVSVGKGDRSPQAGLPLAETRGGCRRKVPNMVSDWPGRRIVSLEVETMNLFQETHVC